MEKKESEIVFVKKLLPFLPPAYVVRREGNSFTLLVCSHLGGYPYPIMLCNISQNAMGQTPGGYPARSSRGGTLPGVPCWRGTLLGGTLLGGYPARGYPAGGYPAGGGGWGYPGRAPPRPGQDMGNPAGGGYPVRTTEGVLTTRRAVCLLHSRRRTFLLIKKNSYVSAERPDS